MSASSSSGTVRFYPQRCPDARERAGPLFPPPPGGNSNTGQARSRASGQPATQVPSVVYEAKAFTKASRAGPAYHRRSMVRPVRYVKSNKIVAVPAAQVLRGARGPAPRLDQVLELRRATRAESDGSSISAGRGGTNAILLAACTHGELGYSKYDLAQFPPHRTITQTVQLLIRSRNMNSAISIDQTRVISNLYNNKTYVYLYKCCVLCVLDRIRTKSNTIVWIWFKLLLLY